MKLSDFDYGYPEELIATHPLPERDASRMMVLKKDKHEIIHSHVCNLPDFLSEKDVVVINDTKVFPARLIGKKESGGKIEILLLKPVVQSCSRRLSCSHAVEDCRAVMQSCSLTARQQDSKTARQWHCITNQTKTSKPGLKINFGDELAGTIISRDGDEIIVEFNKPELIEKAGLPPLPPYIRKKREEGRREKDEGRLFFLPSSLSPLPSSDKERYQTIYAKEQGSSAAPTAGLHFTDELLQKIKDKGVHIVPVTLHVGLDTFSPVRVENIEDHKIHGEEYFISEESTKIISDAKKENRRIIAVGTTSVRVLESIAPLLCKEGKGEVDVYPTWHPLTKGRSITNLFIYPGYKFRVVDAMLTNFHQPKSTLLMLVSAFAGREFIMKAYQKAISQRYRLFSYGDCMLIL